MDASATPAIIAVGAALFGVLLVPRALDTPPPVVREAPVEDEARGPVIDVEKNQNGGWRLTIDADGTAAYVAGDRRVPSQDLMLIGPLDPSLVPQVQALRRSTGPITMEDVSGCIVGGAGDRFASDAPREHHEEASRLAARVVHDFQLKHDLARHELAAIVRDAGRQPRLGATYEVTEILYVAEGVGAPQPGATFVRRDDGEPAPTGERLLAYREGDAWWIRPYDAEEARRLAWLGAHPPLRVEAQTGVDARRAR